MSRTILDADLRRWEVFASSGPRGFPTPAQLVFRCLSDPDQPSRAVLFQGDRSQAEEAVLGRESEELKNYLERATPLS